MGCSLMILTFSFSILFSTFFFICIALPMQINRTETDRLALLAIKSKLTDPPPSRILGSWNDSLSFCSWEGVTCSSRHQRVTKLRFYSQGLIGSLSPFIGNLTFLRSLILTNNSIYGEIPPEIGRLHRLEELKLEANLLGGEIPVNLSYCTNLQALELSYNQLVGKIPIELSSLLQLERLVLQRNNLTGGIPPFIGNLSSLQDVELHENNFEGSIPDSLTQLKNLTALSLSMNMLSGMVPPFLYNISSLSFFYLHTNQLNGSIPEEITLPSLQYFSLAVNQFSGTIPTSLFNASGILNVDVSTNHFHGTVPVEVGNVKGLRRLNLGSNSFGRGEDGDLDLLTTLTNCTQLFALSIFDNNFGGVLPNSISNFSNQLSNLYMGRNQIYGSIPSGIQNLVSLILLTMENNFLTATIPNDIGMLQNLQVLSVRNNRLSGRVPSSLRNFSNLYTLELSDNIFEGNILSDIAKCQLLQNLDLSNNKFDGTIPDEVINLSSKLLYLDLAHNSFVGSLTSRLGNFIHLVMFNVSDNKISGEIPSTIGSCSSLKFLSLKGNFFHGPIPTSFKSLQEIEELDLSMNNLSGNIPKDLEDLPMLKKLNLSFNNLESRVPTKGIFSNSSSVSVLGNNKLCGGVVELHLHACIQKLKKGTSSSILKAALAVGASSIALACVVLVLLCWRKRPQKKSTSETILEGQFERVSYNELYQATNGFSSDNLIGVGSVGSVYKGTLKQDEGPIAVKVLNLIITGAIKSFMTECDALRKIRHRNLLKILTVCSSVDFQGNDFKALVLKFMPNGSLEDWLHPSSDGQYPTSALSLSRRINIAIDIASALDYLHNRCETSIVHCDLKPSNILLDEDMTAHVGDFGLAKFLPKNSIGEVSSTFPRGTIGYIPPDYNLGSFNAEYGSSAEVSTKGDVYSFGILLLEMFTRKRPTDDIFKDNLTLHNFSSTALPLRITEIVDPEILLQEEHNEDITKSPSKSEMRERIQECIHSIMKIGVSCSVESENERIEINDALIELHVVNEVYLGTRRGRQTENIV